jgi:hypothetical protein
VERRHAIRYRLEAPAVVRWEDPLGVRHKSDSITRDVSVRSAFLVSPILPPLDCRIEVDIVITAFPEAPRAWLKGIMKVLRLEDNREGGSGFTVAGDAFTLCTEVEG